MNMTNQEPATTEETVAIVSKIKSDREFRQRLQACDPDALAQIGFDIDSHDATSPKVEVVTSTQDITYIRMPYRELSDEPVSLVELSHLQAANSVMCVVSMCTPDPRCSLRIK